METEKALNLARQLGDLAGDRTVEWSDAWSEDDLRDATRAALEHFEQQERLRPLKPGDVVIGEFPGADETKVRPAVVLPTEIDHHHRPDVVVGLITTQPPKDFGPTDCELRDWRDAGLHHPSFFRLFSVTLLQREVRLIGRLSESDWASVRACFRVGFGNDQES